MARIEQNDRIIFGLKIKELRKQKDLSFADLSEKSGLSVSYLNEIEKGKKFPKHDKVEAIAAVFGISTEDLLSSKLENNLSPVGDLLQSNFLKELPLDLFGIETSKLVELIASAPARVGAFIQAILDIARKHEVQEENFYFAALRSYQELHMNYFEDIEDAVERFSKEFKIDTFFKVKRIDLEKILRQKYGYKIQEGLDNDSQLRKVRFVFDEKRKILHINKSLNDAQKIFILGRELAYKYLGLKERFYTTSIFKVESFEQVLNNFKASYFAVALMINKVRFVKDVQQLFAKNAWQESSLLDLIDRYGATPEMVLYRFTNVLPKYFGVKNLFYLKFNNQTAKDKFELVKELHLSKSHHPHANANQEHYCRRWVSLWLLHALHAQQLAKKNQGTPIIGIQKSQYHGTLDKYLCITLAYPQHPFHSQNYSVTLGMQVDEHLYNTVKFVADQSISNQKVNITCERCSIEDCQERSAPPTGHNFKKEQVLLKKAVKDLIENR